MRPAAYRYAVPGAIACLIGGMLAIAASVTPATASVHPAFTTPTFTVSNADIFDSGYNQSFTSVLTVTENPANAGFSTPFIQSTSPGSGFACGAPETSTATTFTCTITAAPGPTNGDDSGVSGADGTLNTVTVAETDASGTTTATENMVIYPAPICGAAPDGTGSYSGTTDVMTTAGGGSPVAEACYDGANGAPSTLLTNISSAGGTVFLGSNATDAAGGTALTIMTGPGFNWTGSVGSGEADVDTGTAGLNKQVWGITAGATATVGATTTNTTTNLTATSTTATTTGTAYAATDAGDEVSGAGVPPNTTVVSVAPGGVTLTLSNAASANETHITLTFSTDIATTGSNVVTVPSGLSVTSGESASGTDVAPNTTVLSYAGTTLTLSNNVTASTAATITVSTDVVTSGSTTVTSSTGSWPGVSNGDGIAGSDLVVGTTVANVSGATLMLSLPAINSTAQTLAITTTQTSPPPTSWMTSASTVASEASFKSSGDPANTCPPQQAMIDAGMPFCFEEFETTGSGPSAAQVAVDYAGQNLPTAQAPTVALSQSTGYAGSSIGITDANGACPPSIGAGTTNFFGSTYNCWYGRAGDATPVSVTVGGVAANVNPTNANVGDVSEGDYTVGTSSTVTLASVTGGSNIVSTTASSAGTADAGDTGFPSSLIGDSVSGTDIPVGTQVTAVNATGSNSTSTVTLSSNATATPAPETLTFYPVTVNPPQLNAGFTIGAGTPTGSQPVDVCETTTPTNGNDWELGVQWLAPSGSLQYVSGNSGPTQVCTSTTMDVTTAPSETMTTPNSSSAALGTGNSDSALVTGNATSGSPTGTMTFYECGPTATPEPCTSQANQVGSPVGLAAGAGDASTASSVSFTAASTGYWCFAGYYSGDSNYSASADTSTEECFDVGEGSSGTTSTPTHSSIVLGNTESDGAVVTGNSEGGSPTGTVTFYECGPTPTPASCTSQANQVGSPVGLTAGADDTSSAQSVAFTPHGGGYYCFGSYYSGDSNYVGNSDTSIDECFDVTPAASVTISLPGSNRVAIGADNSDNVTVAGNTTGGAPSGSVTFYECGPTAGVAPCTSLTNPVGGPVALAQGPGDVSYASSASISFETEGTYCFAAYYSGDSSYDASSDTTVSECYVVGQAPTITSFNPTSGPVGTTVTVKGTNLSDATEVTFGGVAGVITSNTATKIKVKVPPGAVSGKIKVVTPAGSAKTATSFRVT